MMDTEPKPQYKPLELLEISPAHAQNGKTGGNENSGGDNNKGPTTPS